jgi:hypothetical protein
MRGYELNTEGILVKKQDGRIDGLAFIASKEEVEAFAQALGEGCDRKPWIVLGIKNRPKGARRSSPRAQIY